MIAGHLTCTYVVYRVLNRRGVRLVLPVFLFGAILPDIIDKSLSILLQFPTHGAAHSFFVIFPLTGLSFLLFWDRSRVFISLQLGILMHLVEDLGKYEELLWPFKFSEQEQFSFSFGLYNFYVLQSHPISLFLEILAALICVCLIGYNIFWAYSINRTCAKSEVARETTEM